MTIRMTVKSLLGFAAFGVFWGAWGAALPAVQRRAEVDDGQLGLALVLVGLGALVSMRATGVLIDRAGPRLTPVTVALFGAAAILPALAQSPAALYVFMLALGAASGAMDVAINADAVRAEVRSGRPLVNLAHACFSAAVVAASVATGILRAAGAGAGAVFVLAAVVLITAAVVIATGPREPWEPAQREARPRLLQRFPAWLLLLGVLGAAAYWIENAWQSWGAVYVERTFAVSPSVGALAPALFAGSMAAGRLAVYRLARLGLERVVLVAGAAVAGGGSLWAALAPAAPAALVGIVVAGAGCSVCAPTIVSLAGRAAAPSERATVVGSVTTLMYFGFLVGPAAVGGVAQLTTLRVSLAGVACLAFLLAVVFALVRLPMEDSRGRPARASSACRPEARRAARP
jgi:MFS family permease